MGYVSKGNRIAVFSSEQELEDALNTATFSEPWGVKFARKGFVFGAESPEGEIISQEAQEVLDRMTGLTAQEHQAIINFVNQESASLGNGNWALIDEFFCFSLAGATNPLIGFITKTATNNGAVLSIEGAEFDANSDFIDFNFTPSVDGVNFQQNNALLMAYIVEFINVDTSNRNIVGTVDPLARVFLLTNTAINFTSRLN